MRSAAFHRERRSDVLKNGTYSNKRDSISLDEERAYPASFRPMHIGLPVFFQERVES